MATKIADLKNALKSGARANKYRVNFTVPGSIATTSDLSQADLLVKSTTFPSMTIGQIEVWNQGRKLVIPGDTSYDTTWTVSCLLTEDHGLRRDMISWMRSADHFQNNTHSGNPADVMGEMSVEQLDSAGNPTVRYTFHNVYVQSVGEVTLDDSTTDTISEFDITFSFTDWVVGESEVNEPASFNSATENSVAE